MDDVPVPEHVRRQVAVQLVAVVPGDVVLLSLVPGHKRAVRHVVHIFDLRLQRSGLLLRQRVVHKGQHRVLLLQVCQIHVGVVRHQCKRAHNQQTRHGDADGGEGHEPVGEHVPRAFPDKKFKIVPHALHLVAAHTIADDAALVEQDDPLVEMVHQPPLVGHHDHGGAQRVDALQQGHDLQ